MTLPNVPKDGTMPEAVRSWLERVKREIEAAFSSIANIVIPTKASSAEAVTGTDDEKFLTPLAGIQTAKTFSPFLQFAYFEDQKAASTAGGAAGGGYATRTLNTEVFNNIPGVSLSSNQVSLPAGTYLIEASTPAHRVNSHKCRIYNASTTGVLAYGTSEFAAVGSGSIVVTRSTAITRVTLASTTLIEVQHDVENATNSSDYGVSANMTGVEVYTTLKIWKLD